MWNFGNGFATNVIIFGVHNNYSEETIEVIKDSIDATEQKCSMNFTKAKTIFLKSLNYNGNNSYLFVNGKEICKFKIDDKNVKCQLDIW